MRNPPRAAAQRCANGDDLRAPRFPSGRPGPATDDSRMDSSPSLPSPASPTPPPGWFESLPEEHRERILREDAERLDQWQWVHTKQVRAWWKPCLQACALLAFVSFYTTLFDGTGFLVGALAGLVTGWLWHLTRADRLRSAGIAVFVFFVALTLSGHMNLFAALWGPMPIVTVSVFCGLRREELPGS